MLASPRSARPSSRILCGALLVAAISFGVPGALSTAGRVSAQQVVGELPDPECLRLMRRARIEELRSRVAEELAWLERARGECNEPTAALVALLRVNLRHPLPEDDLRRYRQDLIAIFDDPTGSPPPGVLEFIARGEDVDMRVLEPALRLVERQLERDGVDRRRFLRLRALLEQRLGLLEASTETLISVRALEPENREVAWALLRLFQRGGRWSEAADLLGEMAEGGGALLRSRYARALARAGRVTEANEQLTRLAESIDGSNPLMADYFAEEVLAAAWGLRDAGALEQAEDMFRLAREHASSRSSARLEANGALVHLYGTLEEREAHKELAAEQFRRTTDPHSLLNEGANQLSAGNLDQAIELLSRAADSLGDLEAVWYNLGFAYYRAERWLEAAEALDRASAINDQRADNFFFAGVALVNLERWEDAIPRLLQTVEIDPNRRLAHYNLWVSYRSLGRDEEAARHQAAYDALGEE